MSRSSSSFKAKSMSFEDPLSSNMPDVSSEKSEKIKGKLDGVGMRDIEMPICFLSTEGEKAYYKGKVDAFVSLEDQKSKGIHMSRLYLILQEELEKNLLSPPLVEKILHRFVDSQKGLSQSSLVRIEFDLPLWRKPLMSSGRSWRYYPVFYEGRLKESFQWRVGGEITYSSTCPCSAALSRQLIQRQFLEDFGSHKESLKRSEVLDWLGKPLVATPHAQRSFLKFKIQLNPPSFSLDLPSFIDSMEKILGTPVQTLVKREDEQEFARLNASHLMFCEDVARKIKAFLEKQSYISDYKILVDHIESLHPHTASSFVCKGVEGGFS